MMLSVHMEDYLQKLLNQMSECSGEILCDYVSKYLQGKECLRFFSYGSNMNERKFREDTRNCCYEFGLINVQKAVLQNYKRVLGNDSKNHGLAFTIRPSEGASIEGICHDVPMKGLRSFLKKEGVLLSQPSYELLIVSVHGEDQPVLTLKGLKPSRIGVLSYVEKSKAHSYVRATIEGALRWKVDSSDIQETRDKLEKELQGC